MNHLLDRISDPSARFRPHQPEEYLALRLSAKLGDQHRLGRYLTIIRTKRIDAVVKAFHMAARQVDQRPDQFLEQIAGMTDND